MEPQQRIADYLEYLGDYRLAHAVDPVEFTCGLRQWRDALLSRTSGGPIVTSMGGRGPLAA